MTPHGRATTVTRAPTTVRREASPAAHRANVGEGAEGPQCADCARKRSSRVLAAGPNCSIDASPLRGTTGVHFTTPGPARRPRKIETRRIETPYRAMTGHTVVQEQPNDPSHRCSIARGQSSSLPRPTLQAGKYLCGRTLTLRLRRPQKPPRGWSPALGRSMRRQDKKGEKT